MQNQIPGFLQHRAKTKYLHNIKSEHLLNQSQLGTDQSMLQHVAESNLLQKKTFCQLPHTIKRAQSTLENTTLYLAHSQTSKYAALKMETKSYAPIASVLTIHRRDGLQKRNRYNLAN